MQLSLLNASFNLFLNAIFLMPEFQSVSPYFFNEEVCYSLRALHTISRLNCWVYSSTVGKSRCVHGCVVSSSVLELFVTFSFKRKSKRKKIVKTNPLQKLINVIAAQTVNCTSEWHKATIAALSLMQLFPLILKPWNKK